MSNKLDFFDLMSNYVGEKGVPSERLLRDFQATHPGVLWRKVGKDEYQIKFRQSEQWLNLSSWLGNYLSAERKRLIDQIKHSSQIFSTEEILELLDCSNVSTDFLMERFNVLQEKFYPLDKAKHIYAQLKQAQTDVKSLREEVSRKSKELERVENQSRSEISEATASLRRELQEKLVQLFKEFWKERSGVTGRLSQEDVEELLRRVVHNLE
jgi:multidrug resistance efflux pump